MPNYGVAQAGSNDPPNQGLNLTELIPGDKFTLFNAESPTAPQASVAFNRGPAVGTITPSPLVFTIAAASGTVDIQASNQDVDATYQSQNTSTSLAHDSYSDQGIFAYYRAKLTAGTGPVTVIVQR